MTEQAVRRQRRLRVSGFHWYSSQSGAELRRRPTDLVLLISCLLAMLVLAPAAPGPSTLDERLVATVTGLPAWVA